jgi:hypothetical protein
MSRVELAHPAEGVERDIATEEHAIELSKALRVIWNRCSRPGGLGDCFAGVETPARNCGPIRFAQGRLRRP